MTGSQKLLNQLRPYISEGLRIGVIMGSGDLLAQTAIERRDLSKIDWKRTFKFSAVGLVLVGPILNHWYTVMERLVPKDDKLIVRAFKKMVVDQFLFAPLFNILIIGAFSFLNFEKCAEFKRRLKEDYFTILLTGYSVWPFIQMFNFTMVPSHLQVSFAQICGVFWNCYLSLELNRKNRHLK